MEKRGGVVIRFLCVIRGIHERVNLVKVKESVRRDPTTSSL